MAKRIIPLAETFSHNRLILQRLVIFVLCAAVFFLSQFYRASNAIIAPQLQKDLSLTPDSLGLLSAVFFYSFALMQIPLALFLDRLGARVIITVLNLLCSLGALTFALAGGLYGGVLGRVLMGVGMAANLMGPLKLFTQWFSPGEFATFAGLLVGAGTLGTIAATTPLALFVGWIGWRWTFIAFSAVTAVLAVLFHFSVQEGPGATRPSSTNAGQASEPGSGIGLILKRRDYWLISCGTFFRYGAFMAIQALWAGPYMIEMLQFTPVEAGNIIMLSNIGYVIGCSVGGWLSDRVLSSRKGIVLIGLGGMALAELSLTLSCGQAHWALLSATFFFFGVFAGFGNVMYAHIKGVMPAELSGMALTSINFFTMLGVGIHIHLMGWILHYLAPAGQAALEGYKASFFLTFIGVTVAFVGYLFTHESREWTER